MTFNPRLARLAIEYTKLMNLVGRSRFIKIEPKDVQPGWPPEKYVITYTCKGVAGIDGEENPISSNFHQVEMYMGREYPQQEPYLKWLTPIWHPNIQHEEPHKVCTNNVQNWFPTKPLVDLVVAMGEMVQYKRYHAKWVHPYPLDQIAADWVIRVAEPKGLFGPEKPYDRRPLVRPRGLRNKNQPKIPDQQTGGIAFGSRVKRAAESAQAQPAQDAAATAAATSAESGAAEPVRRAGRITFGGIKKTQPLSEQGTPATVAAAPGPAATDGNGGASPSKIYSLEVWRGADSPKIVEVTKPVFAIGRGGDGVEVDLALDGDQSVSGLHAVLERDDFGHWLTVKGENPVRVNGRVVPRDRMISVAVSDQIEISDFSIRLQ